MSIVEPFSAAWETRRAKGYSRMPPWPNFCSAIQADEIPPSLGRRSRGEGKTRTSPGAPCARQRLGVRVAGHRLGRPRSNRGRFAKAAAPLCRRSPRRFATHGPPGRSSISGQGCRAEAQAGGLPAISQGLRSGDDTPGDRPAGPDPGRGRSLGGDLPPPAILSGSPTRAFHPGVSLTPPPANSCQPSGLKC